MKKSLFYLISAVVVVGVFVAAWFSGSPAAPEVTVEETQAEDIGELYAEESENQPDAPPSGIQPEAEKITQPETATAEEEPQPEPVNSVSLSVDCSDILSNMDSLKEEKRSLVPDSGIIFYDADVEITEGESAFDVLKRALTTSGVHLEFNLAPVSNSAYIEGIGNIYEFDCGERSGWKFSVNGKFPPMGCSDYKIKSGDKIVFIYKVIAY